MTSRQQLLERWKSGLEANSQPTEDSRLHWLRHVYARIYRFLISCYGSGAWRADSCDAASDDDVELVTSSMPFVDYRDDAAGLEPKSRDMIRRKLSAIQKANADRQIPTAARTLSVKSWISIASTRKWKLAERMRRKLAAHGFDTRVVNRTTDYSVQVRYGDFDDARVVMRHGEWRNHRPLPRTIDQVSARMGSFASAMGLIVFGFTASVFLALVLSGSWEHMSVDHLVTLFLLAATGFFFAFAPRR